jgi:hypothetical protein
MQEVHMKFLLVFQSARHRNHATPGWLEHEVAHVFRIGLFM